jgi:ATP-dependent 26S proteasome regulatory subunit
MAQYWTYVPQVCHHNVVENKRQRTNMAHRFDIEAQFVHLARLALAGRANDVELLSRKTLTRLSDSRPDLANEIKKVLSENATASEIARSRGAAVPLPVDLDSRLELLKREMDPRVEPEPIWASSVRIELEALLHERARADELSVAGLTPSRSVLLVGPPGLGKTLAARWLAEKLCRPLLTLDLASVMSSFLGKTGSNIRVVLDFARRQPCVLLLDEFDAIAKRRDDTAEIGELKRLVTVLIQAIDEWPADGVLVAATNHPELLDPAIWRRFDRIIEFPFPTEQEIEQLLHSLIADRLPDTTLQTVATLFTGKSYAEVARAVMRAKRQAILNGEDLSVLLTTLSAPKDRGSQKARLAWANELRLKGFSEREISQRTGLSRQTLSKYREQE